MPQHMRSVLAVVTLLASTSAAAAQTPARPAYQQASLVLSGTLQGSVRDEQGRALVGAMVSVLGGNLSKMDVSDAKGRFALALPPGSYLLKATREGYSAKRDQILVAASKSVELNITMFKQPGTMSPDRPVMVAGVGGTNSTGSRQPSGSGAAKADPAADDHAHGELAWRLREMTRTALRDLAPVTTPDSQPKNFRAKNSILDWALLGSARAATSFFTNTPFTGQLNFMTSSNFGVTPGIAPAVPRGIAYGMVGAPVGARGDWTMRAAMNSGDWSSWALLGEYQARPSEIHAFRVGVSYSTQSFTGSDPASLPATQATSRSAGGMYAFDHWRVAPRLEVDYGARLDQFDYVAEGTLVSPRAGARIGLLPATFLVASVSQRMIAPGAEEFLPPVTGPWLPPERTFDPLGASTFTAERVRRNELGLERELGHHRTIGVRYFRESSSNQMASVFGGDSGFVLAPPPGHFGVANAGDVNVDGWNIRASGEWAGRFTGRVDYAVAQAHFLTGDSDALLAVIAPSVVRGQSGRVHDVTTTLEANVPETATRVAVVYRVDSAFSQASITRTRPGFGARFDVQINQALPLKPIGGSRMELLLAVRNMFHDLREPGSMFDELLTVAPPMRVIGGLQIRF